MKYVLAVLLTATVVTARPAYFYTSNELGQVTEIRDDWDGLNRKDALAVATQRLRIQKPGDAFEYEGATYTNVVNVPVADWYWTADVDRREATEAEKVARLAKAQADADAAVTAQALKDLGTHGILIGQLAQALSVFTIPAGTLFADIRGIMISEIAACNDFASYKLKDMNHDIAESIYLQDLEPAGIVGARLWKAIEVLAGQ